MQNQNEARPLARDIARELTEEEANLITGAAKDKILRTNATGANGDDPADPGI